MNFAEVQQLAEEPPSIRTGKTLTIEMEPTAKEAGRNVILETKGTTAV